MQRYPHVFISNMDDLIWSEEDATETQIFNLLLLIIGEEMKRSFLPVNIKFDEAARWAETKAEEHRKIAFKIERIILWTPEDLRGNVKRLHDHHDKIASRYSAARRACLRIMRCT